MDTPGETNGFDKTEVQSLYIEAYREDNDQYSINLESLIVVFVRHLCQTQEATLYINFLNEKPDDFLFFLHENEVTYKNFRNQARTCSGMKWPVMTIGENVKLTIGGLCSVARQLVKSSSGKDIRKLLGFRETCLIACSENSIWTKFCEVDIIETVRDIVLNKNVFIKANTIELPKNICRFEYHMSQPIRIHNVYKLARSLSKNTKLDVKVPIVDLGIDHSYSEGPGMTLADVILYLPFHIFLNYFPNLFLKEDLVLTYAWYKRVKKEMPDLNFNYTRYADCHVDNVSRPHFEMQSLYKADPKRYKPERRVFTRQHLVEKAISVVKNSPIHIQNEYKSYGCTSNFDWKDVPLTAGPVGGHLPEKRLDRKYKQLEVMANAVMNLAHDKISAKIVDFCSGSGHLGILLAHLLPDHSIILVENKEQSLSRARERIEALKLTNVQIYQGNLDYFNISFDIGVSLHACGTATDLVLEKCIKHWASFVCCPCCYGGIKDCPSVTYPKSEQFKALDLSYNEYLSIAHAADQTHGAEDAKTEQGYYCMDVIDTDRKLHAESAGYEVFLGKLKPLTCTNKNNLLVGKIKGSQRGTEVFV